MKKSLGVEEYESFDNLVNDLIRNEAVFLLRFIYHFRCDRLLVHLRRYFFNRQIIPPSRRCTWQRNTLNTMFTILIINPGSTSTKLAVYHDESCTASETISHSSKELSTFASIWDQYDFRLQLSQDWFGMQESDCAAVVGMGGLLKPVEGGTYGVNETMLTDARANIQGEHASNLGCALANDVAKKYSSPAFIVDPVSVDEFDPNARYSGHSEIERRSLSHALNIHAVARRAAQNSALQFDRSAFIICHLGGGISIAPVLNGKIIDVNDAASDGPFSPERTGGLPLQQFISLCFSKKYSEKEMRSLVMGKGGLVSYLGTNSSKEVEEKIVQGDDAALAVYEAMAYQIAKEIGAMSTVLKGVVDCIVLTGGLAHSKLLCDWINERVHFIAPVLIYPGEDEMKSLALGALRILRHEEQAKVY